ncbi:hypothetical protein C6499_18420 [Candidatus Poribacteria bacterium]|nr:MAG: hypothetical protein C6499_18420 [Candidatus Poribacteria bacterium]
MAYIDKCKEEIGWLKVIFAISTATDISLIAWVIQNYGKTSIILLMIGTLGVLLLITLAIWVNRVAYRKINKLEEL